MLRSLLLLLASVCLLSRCAWPPVGDGDPDAKDVADTELRSCPHDGAPVVDSLAYAVRCAEAFIARNGYTDLPVSDTTKLAAESIEWEASAKGLLESRRGSLAPGAIVVCRWGANGEDSGYTVGFASPNDTAHVKGRAVTMAPTFRGLRLQHVDFSLAYALADTSGECLQLNAPPHP